MEPLNHLDILRKSNFQIALLPATQGYSNAEFSAAFSDPRQQELNQIIGRVSFSGTSSGASDLKRVTLTLIVTKDFVAKTKWIFGPTWIIILDTLDLNHIPAVRHVFTADGSLSFDMPATLDTIYELTEDSVLTQDVSFTTNQPTLYADPNYGGTTSASSHTA